ncbi:hypothetical protein ABZ697_31095 [Streptomyces albidoflavus]|uniref:hypothetical protein n=1 Tax=Streptomyces albidoflavus TaxID=1886 RepID=UPI0033DD77D2
MTGRNIPDPNALRRPERGLNVGDRRSETDPKPASEPRAGRSRGGRRPPPAVATAVTTTLRWDPEEALEIDRWVLDLAATTGRRKLDKAEVLRELVRLAQEHESVHKALVRRLR